MKMKKQITLFALFILLTVTSCEKYLDIKSNNTQAPITTIGECQELLNNMDLLNNGYPLEGILSVEEFYLNNEQYNSDDIPTSDRHLYTWNTASLGAEWISSYAKIYLANLVLESLEKIEQKGIVDVQSKNNVKGQALFFRAFSFWQLAQLYTKPYNTATSAEDLGIPLRLTADINDKSVRGSLGQTYDRILQDLTSAIQLLDPSFIVPTRPTKTAAYALLARVYLDLEDYPKALNSATEALNLNSELMDFNALDKNSLTPFPQYNPEVIFHAVSDGASILNSNDFAKIDPKLMILYGPNDLRKDIFFNTNMTTQIDPATGSNYMDAEGNEIYFDDGTYRFTGNYDPTAGDQNFFVGLAVDELLLIRAECYARSGNTVTAMDDLNTLLSSRWNTNGGITPYIAMSASSADDALIKVIAERRKELVFRGTRWTDLRRLNKDSRFAQTLSRTVLGVTYTLPPNDPRYTLLIPQDAINLGGIEQNQH